MAAGTRLTHHLFDMLFRHNKSSLQYGESTLNPFITLLHAFYKFLLKLFVEALAPVKSFVHCEIFAPAASRRTWILVSESISGLPLSRPVLSPQTRRLVHQRMDSLIQCVQAVIPFLVIAVTPFIGL